MFFKVDKNLKTKLNKLNEQLKERANIEEKDYQKIKTIISNNIGTFEKIEKMNSIELKSWADKKPIVSVDGSTNTYGSTFPHFLILFQAMAKSSIYINNIDYCTTSDILTPLDEDNRREIMQEADDLRVHPDMIISKQKSETLARLEIEVAIKALEKFNPKLIMFDGGFLRYAGKCPDLWEKYKALALEKNILSVGIIEEIGTHEIERHLGNLLPSSVQGTFDREILYGLLEEGEVLFLNDTLQTKKDYYSCFARLSRDPQAIAFDIFGEQMTEIKDIIRVSYNLTNRNSRGINFLIDLVDEQTRLTKDITELFINTYISEIVKQKLLLPKRKKRDL